MDNSTGTATLSKEPLPQVDAITAAAQRLASRVTDDYAVRNEQDAQDAANLLGNVVKQVKQAEAARTALVKPLNDHVKWINAQFKAGKEPLDRLERILRGALKTYAQDKQRKAAEEAARLQAQADAEAERARTVAFLEGDDAPVEAPTQVVVVADTTVRAARATVATRKVWKHRVTDPHALLLWEAARMQAEEDDPVYVTPNDQALREYIRSHKDFLGNGQQPIPGVEFYQDDQVAVG